jgi:hypothetical protein
MLVEIRALAEPGLDVEIEATVVLDYIRPHERDTLDSRNMPGRALVRGGPCANAVWASWESSVGLC